MKEAQLAANKMRHLGIRAGLEVTSMAIELCGARSTFRNYPRERFSRDVRTYTLRQADDIIMTNVGRAALGVSYDPSAMRTTPTAPAPVATGAGRVDDHG